MSVDQTNVTYGFYNSVNGDRVYNASHFGSLFDGLISEGIYGLWQGQNGQKTNVFNVTPTTTPSLTVNIGPGKAWLGRTWTMNDAVTTATFDDVGVAGTSRIDAIVIVVDSSERTNRLDIKKGEASDNPQKPSFTYMEYPIAYVTISGTTHVITAADIEYAGGQERKKNGDVYSGGTPWVVSPLENIAIDAIIAEYKGEFDAWFNEMKGQLSEDAAYNLQIQINNMIKSGSTPLTDASILANGKIYFQYEE